MPTEYKHYDSRGNLTGKTKVKTPEEIKEDNAALGRVLLTMIVVVGGGYLLFSGVLWVVDLLATPSRLSFPHNIFAYFYHYYFKSIFFLLKSIGIASIFLLEFFLDYLIFVKQLTRFQNLNLVIGIGAIVVIAAMIFILLRRSIKKIIAINERKNFFFVPIIVALLTVAPAIIWIAYATLEVLIIWIFK